MQELRDYSLCYLATPYSKFPHGVEVAFREAAVLTAALVKGGIKVYSPIVHSHPLHVHGGIDELDHVFWLTFDEAFMRVSEALIVAEMDGWRDSEGVTYEIGWFLKRKKPILFLDPKTLHIEDRIDGSSGDRASTAPGCGCASPSAFAEWHV